MTREEAIEQLNFMIETIPKEPSAECDSIKEWLDTDKDIRNALEMAIEALEQEPCDDCVSRKAVFETIDDCNSDGLKGIFCSYDDGERFKKYIKELPPVTPTRKKGHWEQYGDFWKEKYRCSECKEEQPKILCGEQIIGYWSDFCPNCGAEMESEE